MKNTLIIAMGLAMSHAAFADPAPAAAPAAAISGPSTDMGQTGNIAIDADFKVALGWVSTSPPMGSSQSTTVIALDPSVDYFISPNLSIGGAVLLQHTNEEIPNSSNSVTATQIGLAPRVGYVIPVGPQLSIWPRGGLAYTHTTFSVTGSPDETQSVWALVASAPLLYHPVPHFFLGLGPAVRVDLSSSVSAGGTSMDSNKTTSLAIESLIGGWF
jgi:hypothetical protein